MSAAGVGGRYASVAVPVPLRKLFVYEVGDRLGSEIEVGSRVRVPLGGRKVAGTVVAWPAPTPDPAIRVKPIESLLSGAPSLPPEVLDLTRFVADYYLCSWGEAIEAALPPDPGGSARKRTVRRLPAADEAALPARAVARRRLLAALPADGTPVTLGSLGPGERRVVPALRRLGWVELGTIDEASDPVSGGEEAEPPPEPTPAQAAVLAQLEPALGRRSFSPHLLFGATGSGKTEVYLRGAEQVLRRGRGVLYLVPEIGLTPLLRSQITRRFPGQVAVLHSALGRRERLAAWEAVRAGRRRLVLGTRSAVFAPVGDPGLIVVDEEQDPSYKQGETPRYNGRDVAVVRARAAGAVVLLGSATPSMESFQHARAGRYGLLRLGGRIEARPLPEVTLIDMREEYASRQAVTPVSTPLLDALRRCLERGDQALVLRNRRGWAVALLCPGCGNRVSCDRCTISLTWHRADRRLRCHGCGFERRRPDACPNCGGDDLRLVGEGTERVEDWLRQALPGAVIERMDRDTIRRRGAHEALLRRFARGEIDILAGTQMIAKGHDFPRVTLVGVLSADQSLGLPDFRAGERTFQLLTQVAGRAGRGRGRGNVIVQAFDTGHPVVRLAATQDYEAFFDREIRYRRALRYPPLAALVRIVVQDREALQARLWAEVMADALRREGGGRLLVTGPGPAPIERVKNRYRQQILARTAGRRRLVQAVDRALTAVEKKVPRRSMQVDVDPAVLF